MNKVIYYSNTNESKKIANYISLKTNYSLINILDLNNYSFDSIYLIFPVYYQSIPKEIRNIIKKIKAKKAIIIATYGHMNHGNALYDAKKLLDSMVVAAAYIPTKHSYIKDDDEFNDYSKLDLIIERMTSNKEIIIPKSNKNIFANFIPIKRHQLQVKIIKNSNCNSCNKCNLICKNIENGIVNNRCIRCLRCISNCPNKALDFKLSFFMRKYLSKKKKNDLIIY